MEAAEAVSAHVAGTSAPPWGERRRPLEKSIGSGERRPATRPSPMVKVGANSIMRRGTWENVWASRSIAAAELTFISTRFSHWAEDLRVQPVGALRGEEEVEAVLAPLGGDPDGVLDGERLRAVGGCGRADVVRLVDDDEHGFALRCRHSQSADRTEATMAERSRGCGSSPRSRMAPRQSGGSWSMSGVSSASAQTDQSAAARLSIRSASLRAGSSSGSRRGAQVAQRVLGVRHRLGDAAEAVVELGVLDRVQLEREGLLFHGQPPVPDAQSVHAVVTEDLDPVRQFLGPAHVPRR